jgi:hypothetical protein
MVPNDEHDAEFALPPDLIEALREQHRRVTEFWESSGPMILAQREAMQAALEQMRPTIEAAYAALAQMQPALEAAQRALAQLPDLRTTAAQGLRRAYPPNWDPDGVRLRYIRAIVGDDGIPIAWVPRGAIVTELMAANNRAERIEILDSHRADIVSDCTDCLEACSAIELADAATMAKRALDAFGDGHYQAGQALAVVVAERIITDHLADGPGPGSYDRAKREAEFRGDIMLAELRRTVAVAPIVRFYARWFPWDDDPPPPELSRHVSVHHADSQQYSPSNALLALMLLVSLLREFTEWTSADSDSG